MRFMDRAGRHHVIAAVALTAAIVLVHSTAPSAIAAAGTCENAVKTEYQAATPAVPAHLIVRCPAVGHPVFVIYIFDRDGEMPEPGGDRVPVPKDTLWIFDAKGDGTANLVINFHSSSDGLIADLYDDQNGDGAVSFAVQDGYILVTESPYPTVRVVAPDGFWEKDGKPNFNLDVSVDGPVMAAFGAQFYLARLKSDGRVDFQIQVRDADLDGRPDYELIRAGQDVPRNVNAYLSELMVNSGHDEVPITNYVVWRLVGTAPGEENGFKSGTLPAPLFTAPAGTSFGYVKNYGESFPPIQVDWEHSRIRFVGEFVASRANEDNWFIYSFSPFGPGQPNYADFENPFAFYDLAGDKDGRPELQIRLEHYGPNDARMNGGRFSQPLQDVRYSWDQFNSNKWDFKVDLIGRRAIDTLVKFADFDVRTVPYNDLPTWVLDGRWDAVTFVAVEKPDYWTSEGIYENVDPDHEIRNEYITGKLDVAPAPHLDWPAGTRGEYNLEMQGRPALYFSPIDRKLHLLRATAGVWKLDKRREIRYDNLGGDYINHWSLIEGDRETKTLYAASNYVIYADSSGIYLKHVSVPLSSFTTLPPRSHDEWRDLGVKLTAQQATVDESDLTALFDRLDGDLITFKGVTVPSFRLTPNGFHLAFQADHSFSVSSAQRIQGIEQVSTGYYRLAFAGRGFSLRRLGPPRLTFDELTTSNPRPSVSETIGITAMIENKGEADLKNIPVAFWGLPLGDPNAVPLLIGGTTVDAEAGQSRQVSTQWSPPAAGDWKLYVEVKGSEWGLDATAQIRTTVQAAPPIFQVGLFSLGESWGPWLTALVLICLGAFALAAHRVLWQ